MKKQYMGYHPNASGKLNTIENASYVEQPGLLLQFQKGNFTMPMFIID